MINLETLPLVEMYIDDITDGVFAISIVDRPAIKSTWIALSENKPTVFLADIDTDKHIVLGAILIPNMPIYRKFGDKEVNIFFSEETIRKTSELYLKNNNQGKTTFMHGKFVKDVTLIESWIVEDSKKDKTAIYGLDLPVGTWAGTMKVDNQEIWDDYIKTGVLTGFSVEGTYTLDLDTQDTDLSDEETVIELKKILGIG